MISVKDLGETETGKTTQISQFVTYAELLHPKGKLIACTQARHVTAMSVAKPVAEENGRREVGYSICMTEPGKTFLRYMTYGVFLQEATNDHDLKRYSTIILDQAHKRTPASDILMGGLKNLAKRRPA